MKKTQTSSPEHFGIGRVARLIGVERTTLIQLAGQVEFMYQTKMIKIGSKQRKIDKPLGDLKIIQRLLHDRVFSRVLLSESVFSVTGKGVIMNAMRHIDQQHMLVLDIRDCFPSITVAMIQNALIKSDFDPAVAKMLTRIVTFKGRLPQGPPSSPAVMNLVLRNVDSELESLAKNDQIVYTRYMDDLCFSGNRDLSFLIPQVKRILRQHSFKVNSNKVKIWGPEGQHTVTKIIVSTELNPNPEFLAALTNELKKMEIGKGQLSLSQIRGKIEWVRTLNPRLGRELQKYCSQLLESQAA